MYNYVFYTKALKDYKEAVLWYEDRSEAITNKLIIAVENRLNSIGSDPYRYRNMYGNFHETSVRNFPYTIVYLIKKKTNTIIISSFYHHKRNPKKKYKS